MRMHGLHRVIWSVPYRSGPVRSGPVRVLYHIAVDKGGEARGLALILYQGSNPPHHFMLSPPISNSCLRPCVVSHILLETKGAIVFKMAAVHWWCYFLKGEECNAWYMIVSLACHPLPVCWHARLHTCCTLTLQYPVLHQLILHALLSG